MLCSIGGTALAAACRPAAGGRAGKREGTGRAACASGGASNGLVGVATGGTDKRAARVRWATRGGTMLQHKDPSKSLARESWGPPRGLESGGRKHKATSPRGTLPECVSVGTPCCKSARLVFLRPAHTPRGPRHWACVLLRVHCSRDAHGASTCSLSAPLVFWTRFADTSKSLRTHIAAAQLAIASVNGPDQKVRP